MNDSERMTRKRTETTETAGVDKMLEVPTELIECLTRACSTCPCVENNRRSLIECPKFIELGGQV